MVIPIGDRHHHPICNIRYPVAFMSNKHPSLNFILTPTTHKVPFPFVDIGEQPDDLPNLQHCL